MQDEIRKSGITVVGNVPWGTHFCQFYQTKQDLIDTLVPYFKAGLENNEFCMWITAENLTEKEIRKAMTEVMPGFPEYLKRKQIEILTYDEWYLKGNSFHSQSVLDGWIEKLNQALKKGYSGLRLTGNTFWLEKEHWRSFTDYEEAINNVIGKYKMIALCTYCLDKCNATEIVDVIRNHEFALIKQEGKWELFENSRYKTTKNALAESEQRYRLIFEGIREAFILQDIITDDYGNIVDLRYVEVNPVAEKLLGKTRNELIGHNRSEIQGPLDSQATEIISKVVLNSKPVNTERYIPEMDVWFEVLTYSPQAGQIATLNFDITERKKAEKKLIEQATMLAYAGDAIIGYDADFRITYWNPGAEKIYGYKEDEALMKVGNILLMPTYTNITREELINRVLNEGHIEVVSSRFTKDGRQIDVETHVIALRNHSGKTMGYVAVDRDITERRQMAKRLTHLASFPELNPSPVIEMDMEGNVEYANATARKMFSDLTEKGKQHPFLVGLMERVHSLSVEDSSSFNREVEVDGQYYEQLISIIEEGKNIRLYGYDITERKRIEEALRQNQRDLAHAQSVAHIGSWRLDIRHNELLWSDETYAIFGISRGVHMTYDAFLSTVHPDDREYVNKKWTDALKGEPYDIEHRILVSNEVKWVREKADLEFDREGKVVGGFGTVQDITERKKAEDNLIIEKTFSETTINSLPGVFYLFKEGGKFLRWNRNFEIVTGYSSEDFQKINLLDLFDSKEKVRMADAIHRVFTEGKMELEANIVLRNGREIPYYFTGTRMIDNSDCYIIGSGIDVSERVQAEQLLRETSNYLNNLLDYANAPIIVWDPQFRISRFNPAFERLTGYKSSDVIGLGLDILFPADKKAEHLQKINRTLTGERWEVVEIPILRIDGTIRTVLWNSANVYDNDGKEIIATIAQGQDITERKQAEEEVEELNEKLKQRANELEASNKELETFAYSVSHDLRAPLRSMEGFSQALMEDCFNILNDQCKDYLRRIQSSAELMAELIDDLLQLSRLTRANIEFNNINLSKMVHNITSDLKRTQAARKVEFVIPSGIQARGDEKLLNIVMYNLLENAWKFTGKSNEARIEFGMIERDGKNIYFVRDNGVGFDMTYVDKIFSPFQRLHTISEFPGTGIGLASVQRIIARHGGQVWADGKVGEGATFYFTLGNEMS